MWTVGVILGFLLQTKRPAPPLFGRGSCTDVLRAIIEKIGPPDPEWVERIPSETARQWIEMLCQNSHSSVAASAHEEPITGKEPVDGQDCRSRLLRLDVWGEEPDLDAIDLISQLCTWEPDQRLTAQQAIAHPFFAEVADAEDEPMSSISYQPLPPHGDASMWITRSQRELDEFLVCKRPWSVSTRSWYSPQSRRWICTIILCAWKAATKSGGDALAVPHLPREMWFMILSLLRHGHMLQAN